MEDQQNNIVNRVSPVYTEFQLHTQRVNSFKNKGWPVGISQNPNALAEAGFFYTGFADKVDCYYCGGGVGQWLPSDNPMTEHIRLFSKCTYVALMKPYNEFANGGQQKTLEKKSIKIDEQSVIDHEQKNVNDNFEKSNITLLQRITKTFSKDLNFQTKTVLDESLASTFNERICKICMINESNVVFTPFGHLLVCKSCASSLSKCPVCRREIIQYIKVYFS